MKRNRKNYTLKVLQENKEILRVQTHSLRRFLTHLRMIKWENRGIRTYIRISYGLKRDTSGKFSVFYNDGWYDNEENLKYAFNCFNEEV